MKPIHTIIAIACLTMLACQNGKTDDASGTFEAVETIVSAEATGKLTQFNIEEGQTLEANAIIGYIDSTQIYLKMRQIEAQIEAVRSRKPDIEVQIAPLKEQLQTAENEKIRVENLMKANAATGKQLDDVTAQIEVLQKQIAAQRSMLENQSQSIDKELIPLQIQNEQLADQLKKCTIRNPISGTVLSKYAEQFEQTAPGKPLYKIADLSNLVLRAYITGKQLAEIKINQTITVTTDAADGGSHVTEGVVTWISDRAEFTPKSIQTKDERANMVYAIKVLVKNDGTFKIGMHGGVQLTMEN